MKLVVDHTLPPAQFNAALLAEARRVREARSYITAKAAEYQRHGWGEKAARELAEFDLAIQRGELQ